MKVRAALVVVSLAAAPACAKTARPSAVARAEIRDADGASLQLGAIVARAPYTVVEFFSAHCPCQRAHDARLVELARAYAPRGVQFVAVDAEAGASAERARREATARGYPFPILVDARRSAADALGAEYATYTVVLDRGGHVHYTGGLDSDRTHLTDDATPYVKDALDDLLAGREPRAPEGKVLGCALVR